MKSETEPELMTDPRLHAVLSELVAREPLFHRPEWGVTRRDFEAMIASDFWEIGASGRRYSRDYVLAVLESQRDGAQPDDTWSADDFHCRKLARDLYLLTYTLYQGDRKTRRTTIWHNTPGGWRALFHQGTVVQGR
jgi:hypothetical protein